MIDRETNLRPARPGRSFRRLWVLGALAFGVFFLPTMLRAAVYLNEMTIRPADVSNTVELYNSGPPVDLTGWTIAGSKGTYTVPAGTIAPTGGYVVLSAGAILNERGGVTTLIDVVKGAKGTTVDAVSYGTAGSAPLPPAGATLARAPDASAGAPPAPDPATDGLVWTIDFTPTLGGPNNAPTPQLGGFIVLNEFDPTPVGGGDPIELVNLAGLPLSVNNWMIVNGDSWFPVSGFLLPHSVMVLSTPSGFDLETIGLIYLLRSDSVRVDQLGFHDAPQLQPGNCFRRCPDGSAPYLGYNYVTSGGGVTFGQAPCTLGNINCNPISVPEQQPRHEITSWGRLRVRFR